MLDQLDPGRTPVFAGCSPGVCLPPGPEKAPPRSPAKGSVVTGFAGSEDRLFPPPDRRGWCRAGRYTADAACRPATLQLGRPGNLVPGRFLHFPGSQAVGGWSREYGCRQRSTDLSRCRFRATQNRATSTASSGACSRTAESHADQSTADNSTADQSPVAVTLLVQR